MFGLNPIRSIDHDSSKLAVERMFFTLQGEGPFAGEPAFFIRLAGCNLACHFCDTQFETQADNPRELKDLMEQINEQITPNKRRLVVMTGGEPFRQNFSALALSLLSTGTQVIQIETAGTLWQPEVGAIMDSYPGRIVIVCSPKTPKVHPEIEKRCKHWKYVVRKGECSPEDGLPAFGTQPATKDKFAPLFRPHPYMGRVIWLSPCDDYDPERNAANQAYARDLCLAHGHRLTLQMHKIVRVE